jgi:hypothetical protein
VHIPCLPHPAIYPADHSLDSNVTWSQFADGRLFFDNGNNWIYRIRSCG